MVGKPNQTIPKAPLQPIPAVQKPFSRIVVDCVGPLPKTNSGNQLVFGHTVRGPLKVLKESLIFNSSERINYLQYHKVKYDRPGECSPEKDCLR